MRSPLIIEARPSPVARAFDMINKTMANQPTQAEQAFREAQARYYGAQADQMDRQNSLVGNLQDTINETFSPHAAGGMGPAEKFIGPVPETGLQMESPEAQSGRMAASLSNLYAQLSDDPAKGLTEGLRVAEAYGGPDNMRRSLVLGGEMPGPDFSPTTAEADRISQRNSTENIAERAAQPESFSEFRAKLGNMYLDNPDAVDAGGRNIIGADDSGGMTVYGPDGQPIVTTGGANRILGKPTNSTLTKDQAQTASFNNMGAMLDYYENIINEAPDEAFGVAGEARQIFQDVEQQGAILAPLLTSMGVEGAEGVSSIDAARNAVARDIMRDPSAKISDEVFEQLYDPSMSAMSSINQIMVFAAAAAFAGQEGRSVTDADVRRFQKVMPSPLGLTGNRAKTLTSINNARNLLQVKRAARDESMLGVPRPEAPGMPSASTTPQVTSDDDYNALPSGTQFIDPEGNVRVKP